VLSSLFSQGRIRNLCGFLGLVVEDFDLSVLIQSSLNLTRPMISMESGSTSWHARAPPVSWLVFRDTTLSRFGNSSVLEYLLLCHIITDPVPCRIHSLSKWSSIFLFPVSQLSRRAGLNYRPVACLVTHPSSPRLESARYVPFAICLFCPR